MNQSKIVITCAPEIAPITAQELDQLGYTNYKIGKLEISLEGSLKDCMYLNMHLRTANRVLFLIKGFKANNPDVLYTQLRKIAWEKWISADGYLCITSYVRNDSITNTQFAQVKVKDAVVDHLMKKCGKRPDSGPERDQTVLYLHWINEHAAIFVDTSGETIAKHGYRKRPYKAPMMENLAAATILQSAWNKKDAFVNPMCGSGTLAIEAALIAMNKPPGLFRDNFGFMHILPFNKEEWMTIVEQAEANIKPATCKIIASDISNLALEAASGNAQDAGVADIIEFMQCDFRKTPMPEPPGVVMINPEYGERLGDEKSLEPLYRQIGDYFKKSCQGFMGYVFTGNLDLAKKIGLKTKSRTIFFNAKIECRLLEYELYQGSKKE